MTPSPDPAETQPEDSAFRTHYRLGCFIILLLSLVVYLPAVRGDLVWDDVVLVNGEGIGSSHSILQCFTRPFLFHYYRPLTSLLFFFDHRIWGDRSVGYHITNLVIHVATTAAMMALLSAAFRNRAITLLGSLLFAVQPVQVSTVAWIGGRTDTLSTLFVALFGWTAIRSAQSVGPRRRGFMALSLACYSLAILAKEQTLLLFPLLPLAYYTFGPSDHPRRKVYAVASTLSGTSIALIFAYLMKRYGNPARPNWHLATQIPIVAKTAIYYLFALLLPTPRTIHTLTLEFLDSVGVLAVLLGYLLIAGVALLTLALKKRAPAAAWFLVMGLELLAPVSNAYPLVTQTVAPYRAGSAGLAASALTAWGLVTAIEWLKRRHEQGEARLVAALATGLAVWCAGLSVWGSVQWRTPLQVSLKVEQYNPKSYFGHVEVASSLIDRGRLKPALARLDTVAPDVQTAMMPGGTRSSALALVNSTYLGDWVGELYGKAALELIRQGDLREAHRALETGVRVGPRNVIVAIAMANYAGATHNLHDEEHWLAAALALRPEMTEKRLLLGRLLASEHRWPQAATVFEQALKRQPTPQTYILAATAYIRSGERPRAMALLDEGMRRGILDRDAVRQWLAQLDRSRALPARSR
jgi:tetratricopeptide (TPR) repeat protein